MSSFSKKHGCTICDYKTHKLFNLERHMVSKHSSTKEIPITPKEIPTSTILTLPNQCDICEKIFSRHNVLVNHKEKCKGKINPLGCKYCNEIFTTSTNKYRHLKICKDRLPSTDLIIVDKDKNIGEGNTIIGDTISIGTNIGKQSIENQNNISIVVYNTDPNKSDNFIKDHITNEDFIKLADIVNNNPSDENKVLLIEEYSRNLFKNPQNRCIKKTNMRDIYSKIHIGDNNWITKTDKDLYPQLTCNMADGLTTFIQIKNNECDEKVIQEIVIKNIINFLDYMADNGYRNDDNEEVNIQTNKCFRDVVKKVKTTIYDSTMNQV